MDSWQPASIYLGAHGFFDSELLQPGGERHRWIEGALSRYFNANGEHFLHGLADSCFRRLLDDSLKA